MADLLYDLEGYQLTNREILVEPGEDYDFKIQGDCRTGKFLRASVATNFSVFGRFEGIGSFINLMTTGLDLSAYDGQVKTFDIKVEADDINFSLENTRLKITN